MAAVRMAIVVVAVVVVVVVVMMVVVVVVVEPQREESLQGPRQLLQGPVGAREAHNRQAHLLGVHFWGLLWRRLGR